MTNIKRQTESQACKAWLDWLTVAHPKVRAHVIKLDNEGTTNRANAVRLGLHVGASDYFIAWPTDAYNGCFIEAKRDGYRLTESNEEHHLRQVEFGRKMRLKGYAFYMCYGVDELMNATENYLQCL